MNIEQKKSAVTSFLISLIEHFGLELIEWAIAKIKAKIDDGEVSDSVAKTNGNCPPGYYFDVTTGTCKLDVG